MDAIAWGTAGCYNERVASPIWNQGFHGFCPGGLLEAAEPMDRNTPLASAIGIFALWGLSSHAQAPALEPRPFEARLSGAPHAEFRSPSARTLRLEDLDSPELQQRFREEARIVLAAAAPDAGSREQLDLARVRLLQGRTSEALRILQRAAESEPDDLRVLNDLAAAHLVRSREEQGSPFHLVEALEILERPAASSPASPEVEFNRALALSRLGLSRSARSTWERLAGIEQDPGWRREAEQRAEPPAVSAEEAWTARLLDLEESSDPARWEAAVREFPQQARVFGEEVLLARWAAREIAAGPAGPWLEQAAALGRFSRRETGDSMLEESARAIAESLAGTDVQRTELLARGHRGYGRGLQLQAEQQPGSRQAFLEAEKSLRDAGSPFSAWAALNAAISSYYSQQYPSVVEELETLLSSPGSEPYPVLRGRIHYMLGLTRIVTGKTGPSRSHYRQALEYFESSRQTEYRIRMLSLLADAYSYLGERRPCWTYWLRTLRQLDVVAEARVRYGILNLAANSSLEWGRPAAALHFQSEALAAADETGQAWLMAEARLWRARVLHRLGHSARALEDLADSRRRLRYVRDPEFRPRLEADIDMTEGQVRLPGSAAEALPLLESSLIYYRAKAHTPNLIQLHLELARARRRLGDTGGAREHLERALLRTREKQTRTQQPPPREYLESLRGIYDELIGLDLELGLDSLRRSEEAREVLLRETLPQGGNERTTPRMGSKSLASHLPPGSALLQFAVLPDTLVTWTAAGGEVTVEQTPLDAAWLEARVEGLARCVDSNKGAGACRPSSELHHLLIAPFEVRHKEAGWERLVIVPDKVLSRVPFAFLSDAQGRYLVQRHALTVTPSAGWFVAAERRARESRDRPLETLVVAFPGPSPLFPDLPVLRGAQEEARRVSGWMPAARLLLGDAATKPAVLESLDRYPVSHFAGHALARPGFSGLLLAGNPDEDASLLSSRELARLEFHRSRLVVLAACRSGVSRPGAERGALNLAEVFLLRGVPTVVSAVVDLDDTASLGLWQVFYQELRRGRSAAEALREAQLARIAAGAGPREWAPFQVFGR